MLNKNITKAFSNLNKAFTLFVVLAMMLSGCTTLGFNHSSQHNKEEKEQFDRVDKHSSFPAVRRYSFEQVNLVELVTPDFESSKDSLNKACAGSNEYDKFGCKYDLAFAKFRKKVEDALSEGERRDLALDKLKIHRNSVQDKIIAVASSRCNVFKTYLRRDQVETNYVLGSFTTAAGVLGALLTGVDASRVLAGTAGILSGVQAEYNSNYFNNLAAHVIAQGIELKQTDLLNTLSRDRQSLSVTEYSMEAAVRDALIFDGSCSTVTGLQAASESIKEQTTPSFSRAIEMMTAVRAANSINNAENLVALSDNGELTKLLKLTSPKSSPLVASMTKKADVTPRIEDKITNALSFKDKKAELIVNEEKKVLALFDNAVKSLPKAEQAKIVVKPDDVKKAYQKVIVKIGDTDKSAADSLLSSALNRCVDALDTPVTQYGNAKTDLLKTLPDTPKRLAAEKQLAISKIDLEASLLKAETVFSEIQKIVQTPAIEWADTLKKKEVTKKELDELSVPNADNATLGLCK